MTVTSETHTAQTAATQPTQRVDHNALRFGTASTIVLLAVAFLINAWPLVAFVAVSQLLGALNAPFAPYRLLYRHIALPAGLLQPHIVEDNPQPHRFAMLVGAMFNGGGTLLLALEAGVGWLPVLIVVVLANIQFWLNICVGCLMYYQFNRLGVPGFSAAPLS